MDTLEAILLGALDDVLLISPDESEAKEFVELVKRYMADNDLIVKPAGQLTWNDASK